MKIGRKEKDARQTFKSMVLALPKVKEGGVRSASFSLFALLAQQILIKGEFDSQIVNHNLEI